MKITSWFTFLVIFSTMLLTSCFDEPSFGPKPVIEELERIEFIEGTSIIDTLNIYVRFKDGDGNLGLSTDAIDSPFHNLNFFTGNGTTLTPAAAELYSDFSGVRYKSNGETPIGSFYVIRNTPLTGTFVSLDDKDQYGLPSNVAPYNCNAYKQSYYTNKLIVRPDDGPSLNPDQIIDTLISIQGSAVAGYVAQKSWYVETNPYRYNIWVRFFVKNGNTFEEYDFTKEHCTTFDARFPPLADNKRPLEGTIKYSMQSSGFTQFLGSKVFKLKITIVDRGLNESNVLDTDQYTLNEIRK